MNYRVAAVIPAHNEEMTIAQAVRDIASQTYPVDLIVVVNDCSTDRTGEVLADLQCKHPQLSVIQNDRPTLRAGAINRGLSYLQGKPIDLIMAADADSRFDKGLVAAAVGMFQRHYRLGGVCTTSGVLDREALPTSPLRRFESWILWRLQRLDGAGFDAVRTATRDDVQILHGLCSVFRMRALLRVGGYSSGHMLEDYELTLRLKKDGWQAMYCPQMKAWTRVPSTFKAFFRQRVRWMRGGFDILIRHGIDRFTFEDALNHLLFILLFAGIVSYLGICLVHGGWHLSLTPHPVPITLACTSYAWSLYRLKFLDRLDVGDAVICAVTIPGLLMASVLSALQFTAYYRSIFRCPQKW